MRENGFRAVGGLAHRLASGLAQRREKGRGASVVRLRVDWSAIVGPDLARISRPEALVAGRGRAGGKVLRLRVPGASALEVQHMTGQIVERVNAYFGHRMVDDIRLVQGAITSRAAPPPVPAPDRRTLAAASERVASVKDPELRAALARLGARVTLGRRHALLGALGSLFVLHDSRAQDASRSQLLAPMPGDHLMGRPDAPNVLIDYASFTCPFCAEFYIAVVPELRKEWIDAGKLLMIHRHFPLDVVATRASQLAECAGPDRFFDTAERLFRTQVEWLSTGDPLVEMVKVLAPLGVTEAAAQACFADDRVLDKVIGDVQSGQTLGVRSTPSIFINDENYSNPGGMAGIAAILRQVGR